MQFLQEQPSVCSLIQKQEKGCQIIVSGEAAQLSSPFRFIRSPQGQVFEH